MTATLGRTQYWAYLATRNGRSVAFVACNTGCWHQVSVPDDARPGDLLIAGIVCRHRARISPRPFQASWRSRTGLITPRFAAEEVRPSWFEI